MNSGKIQYGIADPLHIDLASCWPDGPDPTAT
jgi:hypothetical protein